MPSLELLYGFFAATLVFAYVPGPALMYTTAQTLARGRRAGLWAAFGLHIGGYVHVIAAAAGLSALFHAVPVLYTAVKLVGAGYLVWLGIGMVRSAMFPTAHAASQQAISKSGARAFAESVTVEVLNPKTALFFIAFLPQFVDASAAFPIWLQFLVLGVATNLILSSADLVCIVFAGLIVDRMRQTGGAARVLEGLGGGVLVGLGVHMARQGQ